MSAELTEREVAATRLSLHLDWCPSWCAKAREEARGELNAIRPVERYEGSNGGVGYAPCDLAKAKHAGVRGEDGNVRILCMEGFDLWRRARAWGWGT